MTAKPAPKPTRKQRRADRRAEASRLVPPEGVPINLEVAGVGVRMGAQLTDILITTGAAVAIIILFSWLRLFSPSTLWGLFALLFFMIRIPYYTLTELFWNGQTLGKRLLKIKVVSHSGGPLTTHALVVRNLFKEAEVFLPGTLILTLGGASTVYSWMSIAWVAMAFIIPLSNPYRMRLGDLMANTHVVHLPDPVLLTDLSSQPAPRGAGKTFEFLSHQLDHYGRFELQTLEALLRAPPRSGKAAEAANDTLVSVVDKSEKRSTTPIRSRGPKPWSSCGPFMTRKGRILNNGNCLGIVGRTSIMRPQKRTRRHYREIVDTVQKRHLAL